MGLAFVASINANTNPVSNRDFFTLYAQVCALPGVDFMTSWQWPQQGYPQPSFAARIDDPAVQDLVARLPEACRRAETVR